MPNKFWQFFSNQARRPSGLFGRLIMSRIFKKGNAPLNEFVRELISVEKDDHILEIGFGPGDLMNDLAKHLDQGSIDGIDFSSAMVAVARKRNKKYLASGKVKIKKGDFEKIPYQDNAFDKICSVNTIYFWPNPEQTIKKIFKILKPGGKLCLGFEDTAHLEKQQVSKEVFHFYSENEVKDLLANAGFSAINVHSKEMNSFTYHCAAACK